MQRNSTIGELMERKRIQDGAKEYQGHTYMDLARFDEATKHMIIFDVLTDESPVGWKTVVIRQNRQLIFSRKKGVLANENATPANQTKNRAKKPANQKRRMF